VKKRTDDNYDNTREDERRCRGRRRGRRAGAQEESANQPPQIVVYLIFIKNVPHLPPLQP
jgi:hypothetical protein